MPKLTAKQKHWSEQLLRAGAFEGPLTQNPQNQNIPVQSLYYWRSYLKRLSAIETKTRPAFTQVVSASAMDFLSDCKWGMSNYTFHGRRIHDGCLSLLPPATHHDAPRPRASRGLFVC